MITTNEQGCKHGFNCGGWEGGLSEVNKSAKIFSPHPLFNEPLSKVNSGTGKSGNVRAAAVLYLNSPLSV